MVLIKRREIQAPREEMAKKKKTGQIFDENTEMWMRTILHIVACVMEILGRNRGLPLVCIDNSLGDGGGPK